VVAVLAREVSLPADAAPEGASPYAPDRLPDARPRPVFLLAQPDPALADGFAAALCATGAEVIVVPDGLQLLFELERRVPDILVLDLELPLVSAYRVLDVLRRDPLTYDVPVVLISDVAFQEARDAVRLGVEAFFTKPVSPEELVEHASRLVHTG
jgi:chemosensory pili system protein ChpA (sensor histidine kinase/response regulator)